jgi:hypothetical protein
MRVELIGRDGWIGDRIEEGGCNVGIEEKCKRRADGESTRGTNGRE